MFRKSPKLAVVGGLIATSLLGFAFASTALAASQEKPNPKLISSKAISKIDVATVNGNKAVANSVLARLKKSESLNRDNIEFFSSQGITVDKNFSVVDGLLKLTFESLDPTLASHDGSEATSVDLASQIKRLMSTGKFEYVEPDWIVHLLTEPNDSAYTDGTLWGLNNTGQSGGLAGIDINVIDAWSRNTGSSDIVVGVVDTGIRYTHQDIAANMWTNPDEIPNNGIDDDNNGYIDDVYGMNAINGTGDPFDDHNHGTHCAGTIAGTGNDAGEIVGVAYTTKLMALKFLSAGGSGTTSDAIESIQYALGEGVDILSNSWGGGGFSQSLLDVIEAANDDGVLFIAAAGNSAANSDDRTYYPQGYEVDNVISVAAIDRYGNLASFSNYGLESVDIAAPGVAVYSSTATSDSSYSSYNGTSMATPHVAGVAALLLSEYPSSSVSDLKSRLLNTATFLPSLDGRVATGGMVNATAALTYEADGILELRVRSEPLESGADVTFDVSVSDLTAVTDATVTGGFAGNEDTNFYDNGSYPDEVSGDGVYSGSLAVPDSVTSVTFAVNVSAPGKEDAYAEYVLPVTTRPDNNDFANRIKLVAGTLSTTGENRYATSEPSEPIYPGVAGGKTVWWEWVSPENPSEVIFTTFGSNYDTTLAIYRGTSLNSLVHIGSNDDNSGLQSSVRFTPEADEVYQIQVDGYSGREGDIVLNYPEPAYHPDAPVITEQPVDQDVLFETEFTLSVEATGESQLQYQWYKRVNNDFVAIDGATSDSYSADTATQDHQGYYRVRVENSFGYVNSKTVYVSINYFGFRPSNDNFLDATVISGQRSTNNSTNVLASRETMEPLPAQGAQPVESIWYSWTAPSTGNVEFSTEGSDFDTILAVYEGDSVNSLTRIAVNDDVGPGTFWSRVSFETSENTIYKIVVDGYGKNTGNVTLSHLYSGLAVPDNDAFDQRVSIGLTGIKTGTNVNASGQENEPEHAGVSAPLASVWWTWTSPVETGDVTISTVGSDFDTTLAVYEGNDINNLTLIADNDDFDDTTSRVTFYSKANTEYSIAVDGFDIAEGNIVLDVSMVTREGAGVAYDYDGDGSADLAVRRPNSGRQFIKLSTDGSIQRSSFGARVSDVPVSGDFDDDGISDLAIFRTTDGSYYILRSSDGEVERQLVYTYRRYHEADFPVPADYDGDGVTDTAIYRPLYNSREWIIRYSNNRRINSTYFGPLDDSVPVPNDFDGDGIADLAAWKGSTGYWYIKQSTSGAVQRLFFASETGDIPIPADYDGDGMVDIAIRRPSNGMWYIRYSSTEQIVSAYFGSLSTDIPVPADYDGDGKADIAIRRPNSGQIIYAQSSNDNAIRRVGFGSQTTDIPIAAPIIHRMALSSDDSQSNVREASNPMHDSDLEFGEYLRFELLSDIETKRIFHQEIIEEESMH